MVWQGYDTAGLLVLLGESVVMFVNSAYMLNKLVFIDIERRL